ncbi:MAG TPA: hypothetical protein PKW95_09920 [bacterium]|nr:hypothetical protein [bacterium]
MKFKVIAVLLLIAVGILGTWAIVQSSDKKVSDDCTFNGKKMYGKVQIVEHFPDIKIQIVEHFPDLKVKTVEHFPDSCGKWQFVENFPDFKVQIVEHFPDLKVQYVNDFPGLP